MLLLVISASLLWSVHFLLLGAVTGAAMNLLTAGRSYVYYKLRPAQRHFLIPWAFVVVLVVVTAWTWQGMTSLLPLIGSVSGVIAFWLKNPKYIRRVGFTSSPPWLIYNILSGSYPGMVVEVLLMVSNLIGQYRFDLHHTSRRKLLRIFRLA